jgi:hypothetical protein
MPRVRPDRPRGELPAFRFSPRGERRPGVEQSGERVFVSASYDRQVDVDVCSRCAIARPPDCSRSAHRPGFRYTCLSRARHNGCTPRFARHRKPARASIPLTTSEPLVASTQCSAAEGSVAPECTSQLKPCERLSIGRKGNGPRRLNPSWWMFTWCLSTPGDALRDRPPAVLPVGAVARCRVSSSRLRDSLVAGEDWSAAG